MLVGCGHEGLDPVHVGLAAQEDGAALVDAPRRNLEAADPTRNGPPSRMLYDVRHWKTLRKPTGNTFVHRQQRSPLLYEGGVACTVHSEKGRLAQGNRKQDGTLTLYRPILYMYC